MTSEQTNSSTEKGGDVEGDVRVSVSDEGIEVAGITNPRKSRSETEENIGQEVGNRIAYFRKKNNKKQAELAEEIGKTNSWLSKIESGSMRFMFEDLVSLADALDVSVRRFIPPNSSLQETIGDFAESGDGATFLLKLGGAGMDVAVADVIEEEGELQSRVRKKIARSAGRVIAKAVLKHFRLEQERIEELVRKHDFIRDGVVKGYRHVMNTCQRDGETVLTVRIASPGEAGFDQEGTVTISLGAKEKDEADQS